MSAASYREMRVRVPLETHRAAKVKMAELQVQSWDALVAKLLHEWTTEEVRRG